MVPARSELALGLRSAQKYAAVNGGVLIVAWLVTSIDWAVHSCTASLLASAVLGTAVLYALVYRICAANLQDRRPIFAERRLPAIPLMALIWHPLGAMLERMLHGSGSCAPSAVAAVSELLPGWLLPRAFNWYGGLVLRLLAFELTYDFFFYWAHRAAHAHPLVYRVVHKLHHAHTHDVRILSALQMGPLDVLFTHTLPVLGALAIIPLAPGFEHPSWVEMPSREGPFGLPSLGAFPLQWRAPGPRATALAAACRGSVASCGASEPLTRWRRPFRQLRDGRGREMAPKR